MKKKIAVTTALAALSLLAAAGPAGAQDEPKPNFIYATYHTCDVSTQKRADEIVDKIDAPVLDAAVKDGTITGWGYMAHHTGGKWRRLEFTTGTSVEALLAAQDKTNKQMEALDKGGKLGTEFGKICSSHDDYIWHTKAGKQASGSRGKMGFSVYYVCDSTREDQADAIVEQVFGPMQDKLVADGQLLSWGWLEHIVGGQIRRVATMTAADLPSLMKARAAMVKASNDNPLGSTFTSICGSHSDYIWEIQH